MGASIGVGANEYERSIEVEKILSSTSARVVNSSRTKDLNDEPVVFRTEIRKHTATSKMRKCTVPSRSVMPAVTVANSLSFPFDESTYNAWLLLQYYPNVLKTPYLGFDETFIIAVPEKRMFVTSFLAKCAKRDP